MVHEEVRAEDKPNTLISLLFTVVVMFGYKGKYVVSLSEDVLSSARGYRFSAIGRVYRFSAAASNKSAGKMSATGTPSIVVKAEVTSAEGSRLPPWS